MYKGKDPLNEKLVLPGHIVVLIAVKKMLEV